MAGNKSTSAQRHVVSVAIDDVALASLREQQKQVVICSVCDTEILGEPTSSGLLMWTRGDDVRYDEPPICSDCANTLNVTAFVRWSADYDE